MSERAMAGAIYPYRGISPTIAPSVYLAPGAVVIGNVTIGDDCAILANAVIRGDTNTIVIERGTNIQESATVHVDADAPCHIGAYCVVGHNAIVHGSTVGDMCLVGMHSTILSKCVVGAGSIIG